MFSNVFCGRGDFGLWGSGWGSLWVFSVRAGVRAVRVFLLLTSSSSSVALGTRSLACLRCLGSRWVCSFLLPRVALGYGRCLLREQRRDEPPLVVPPLAPWRGCVADMRRFKRGDLHVLRARRIFPPSLFGNLLRVRQFGVPCDHSHRRVLLDVPKRLCDPRRRGPPI